MPKTSVLGSLTIDTDLVISYSTRVTVTANTWVSMSAVNVASPRSHEQAREMFRDTKQNPLLTTALYLDSANEGEINSQSELLKS